MRKKRRRKRMKRKKKRRVKNLRMRKAKGVKMRMRRLQMRGMQIPKLLGSNLGKESPARKLALILSMTRMMTALRKSALMTKRNGELRYWDAALFGGVLMMCKEQRIFSSQEGLWTIVAKMMAVSWRCLGRSIHWANEGNACYCLEPIYHSLIMKNIRVSVTLVCLSFFWTKKLLSFTEKDFSVKSCISKLYSFFWLL